MKTQPAPIFLAVLSLGLVGIGRAEELSVKALPAAVVKTSPASGDSEVDASKTTKIKVVFSKPMQDKNWSWAQLSDESFPEITGGPKYLEDHKTCVIDVKLKPDTVYAIWINSQKFGNFKDTEGISAVPYLLVFKTK